MNKTKIRAVLRTHYVYGTSGLGVEEILCGCSTGWRKVTEYEEHLADKLMEAEKGAQNSAVVRALEVLLKASDKVFDDRDTEDADQYNAGAGEVENLIAKALKDAKKEADKK